jgi:SAM-dependent methyltransferase
MTAPPAANRTTRFSNRVDDYIKYRPHYPVEILDLLAEQCSFSPDSVVADIGAGTGILAKLFLDNGNPVLGVEPNTEMREAAERLLADYARYTSIDGSAEATQLPAECCDLLTAGQAFHWFEPLKARQEFLRILRPEGYAAILFNDRRTDSTPFLRDYEAFLQTLEGDYKQIDHKNISDEAMLVFFGGKVRKARFDNAQRFDLAGLIGRVASSSYCPARDDPRFADVTQTLTRLFEQYAQPEGCVVFEYDTIMYYGHML